MDDFFCFRHHRINDHVYVVRESFGYDRRLPNSYFFIGVVVGSERVAVFDSGNGATAGLRAYIEDHITGYGKPIDCFLSHNHLDHIGGCMLFDHRYLHQDDFDTAELAWATNLDRHLFDDESDLAQFCCHDPEILAYCREHYLRERPTLDDFIPVVDGQEFDLGGITLRAMHTPGHSRGSCCYYDVQDHIAFTGDAIPASGLSLSPVRTESGESETIAYLRRARREWDDDALIVGGHHFLWGMDLIDKLLDGYAEIAEAREMQVDIVSPPPPFKYQKGSPRKRVKAPGTFMMRHYHHDVDMNYQVSV